MMRIPLTLNGDKIVLEAQPEDSLMKILHDYGCISVKSGCQEGFCGACSVLFDDKPVSSCKMPVGLAKDATIITLESFSRTDDYRIILEGFAKAGIKLCGHCNAGKIFAAYHILSMGKTITKEEIAEQIKSLSPCCTDMETLSNGIIHAIKIKEKSMKGIMPNE